LNDKKNNNIIDRWFVNNVQVNALFENQQSTTTTVAKCIETKRVGNTHTAAMFLLFHTFLVK